MITLRRPIKVVAFLAGLAPLVWLLIAAATDNLSANPIKDITESTGVWTLRFLIITLCITPMRKLTSFNEVIRYRRMLGLFAFFYGFLHFMTYVWLDQFFAFHDILLDVYKRPFITAGFIGFMAMVPLAVTSTKRWIARLGGRQWQRLHRLAYLSAVAGVIHYLWLVKAAIQRPVLYGLALSILLGYRLFAGLPVLRGERKQREIAA